MLNANRFCKEVRRYRKREGLTLQDLSKRSGVNASQISTIENGSFPAKITTINKLQKGLNMSDKTLMNALGYHIKNSRAVRIVPEVTNNFEKSFAESKKFLSFISAYIPKDCFIVKVYNRDSQAPDKHSVYLVDRHFEYISGDIYTVWVGGRILVGKIYKSHDKADGVLLANGHSYFVSDYRGRYKVLGRVVRIMDML